jgi:hypothetical protein
MIESRMVSNHRRRILTVLACVAALAACGKSKSDVQAAKDKAAEAASSAGAAVKDSANSIADAAKAKSAQLVETAKQKGASAMAAAQSKTAELSAEVAQKKDELVKDVQARLGTIDNQLATLQSKADHAQGAGRQQIADSLTQLRAKRDDLRQRMTRLGSSSGAAWDDVAAGVRSAAKDLEDALAKAMKRFQ